MGMGTCKIVIRRVDFASSLEGLTELYVQGRRRRCDK